jgi:tetratricopeptide (TPR) repeat protein
MLGRTISHYRISSQLGAGGMGVVYAGEDVRLGRPVALKFVPEDLAREPLAIERLRAEARAASALNHANICTIYDVGEYEGRPYIVMELLKGQTLRDSLASGPLRVHQVVDIGIQVADALDAAHGRGILHRDIKPANLFLVERGVVKTLDFGLAKHLAQPSPGSTTVATAPELVTAEGVTVGTVSYMSPEQVTGEQLDGRTDLFSLGIVLYECVTGHRPFTGKTSAVILSAILNQSPVAPVVFNPQIPLRLQDAINNCLEKDRELRYQDAAGLRADLKRIRRDLESGHSNALKAVGAPIGVDALSTPRRGRPIGVLEPDVRPTRRMAPLVWGATLTAAGVIGLTSYWYWNRTPARPPVTNVAEVQSSDAAWRSRLNLATASLAAGNYREALGYAEEVLRLAPEEAEATRVRDEARTAINRFDEAIARGNRLLASGDADAASAALRTARAIDSRAPAVADLSERILAAYRTQAAARPRVDQSRSGTGTSAPSRQTANNQPPPQEQRPATPTPAPTPVPAAVAPVSVPPTPAPSAAPPPSQASSSVPQIPASPETSGPATPAPGPGTPQPTAASKPDSGNQSSQPARPVEPERPRAEAQSPSRGASGGDRPAVEDDDTMIRRLVDTWARAIETKSIELYRSVKPNMSAEEQRRIEAGFGVVSSQRVGITILGIEHRGQQAVVRLRRRDTIVGDGRQQIKESQQILTVIRSGPAWVISEMR